jgi:hypothetical protein
MTDTEIITLARQADEGDTEAQERLRVAVALDMGWSVRTRAIGYQGQLARSDWADPRGNVPAELPDWPRDIAAAFGLIPEITKYIPALIEAGHVRYIDHAPYVSISAPDYESQSGRWGIAILQPEHYEGDLEALGFTFTGRNTATLICCLFIAVVSKVDPVFLVACRGEGDKRDV